MAWIGMIYNNLLKLKDELENKPEEKPKLKRVMSILTRRYEYGIDTFLDDLRREDHLDEIRDIERMRT